MLAGHGQLLFSTATRQSQKSSAKRYGIKQHNSHCKILSEFRTYFLMSQKSKSMLEFQAHICWVITVDYKVRLGQVKSEFDWKRPKLTRSVRALKLSIFSMKSHSVYLLN